MKRLFLPFCLLAVAVMLASCGGKTQQRASDADSLSIIEPEQIADTTLYGRCGEGTSMNFIELIIAEGDTLHCNITTDEDHSVVRGGLGVGDRLAVVTRVDEDGQLEANKVINLTTLLGKWISIDQSFELQEGGVVVSNIKEPRPLTDWSICNGHFVLGADTFDIYELGVDSLYLENANGIYAYKRLKN